MEIPGSKYSLNQKLIFSRGMLYRSRLKSNHQVMKIFLSLDSLEIMEKINYMISKMTYVTAISKMNKVTNLR